MPTALRYMRLNEQFFVFSRRAPHMILRDARDEIWDEARKEKEHIIAQLSVDMIEKYHYRLGHLHVQELIPIVSQSGWQYPEADILVEGHGGNPRLIIKALPHAAYHEGLAAGIEELFLLARAIPSRKTTPLFIIPYTRWQNASGEGTTREEFLVINASIFPTSDAWIRAGRPTESQIPSHEDASGATE